MGGYVWSVHPCKLKYFWSITRGGLWWEGSLNGGTTVYKTLKKVITEVPITDESDVHSSTNSDLTADAILEAKIVSVQLYVRSKYRIAGIFRSAKVSFFFLFCNDQERKLDVVFFKTKMGVAYQLYGKTKLKPTKSSLSPKKQNYSPMKYTR